MDLLITIDAKPGVLTIATYTDRPAADRTGEHGRRGAVVACTYQHTINPKSSEKYIFLSVSTETLFFW